MEYMLLLSAFWTGIKGLDPCVNHKFLGQTDLRGDQCYVYDVGSALCDRLSIINKEWFAAKLNDSYLEMPTVCPNPFGCDTAAPIWLNGTHPNSTDGIVEREFCVRSIYPNECCKTTIPARIKNCGTYFVYELTTTTDCDSAYCFGNHKCPASVYDNSTGLPPNDPCITAKSLPKASLRGTNCPVYEVETPICDRLITPAWYSVKVQDKYVDMPTKCFSAGTCGTSAPIWLDGTLPSNPYEIVTRKACTAGYRPGECCKKTYDIMVKNCVSYNVYYLPYTDSCDEAFCFGSQKCIFQTNSADVSNDVSHSKIVMYTGIAAIVIVMVLISVIIVLRSYTRNGRWSKVSAAKSNKTENNTITHSDYPTDRNMIASPPPPYKAC